MSGPKSTYGRSFPSVLLQSRILLQAAFPVELRADDLFEIVVMRSPTENLADALRPRHQGRWIASAPWTFNYGQRASVHPIHHRDHLSHAVSVPVAAIERGGRSPVTQVVERLDVRGSQVLDVDIVAHARAVGSRVVGAEDRHVRDVCRRPLRMRLSSATSR